MVKPEQDAFGQALMYYLNEKGKQYTIKRDDGYINILETGTYFTDYEDWLPYEKEAIKHVQGRVLDVECGAGSTPCTCRDKDMMFSAQTPRPLQWRSTE